MTYPAANMKRITLDISEDLLKKLNTYCFIHEVKRSHLLRELIEAWIDKNSSSDD